jgi:hypothetical protein
LRKRVEEMAARLEDSLIEEQNPGFVDLYPGTSS